MGKFIEGQNENLTESMKKQIIVRNAYVYLSIIEMEILEVYVLSTV